MSRVNTRMDIWLGRIDRAADGREAVKIAVSFLLAEIKRVSESRPEDAEEARWHVAREITKFAVVLERRRAERRPK